MMDDSKIFKVFFQMNVINASYLFLAIVDKESKERLTPEQ